jgi:hypothetical protein
MECGLWRGQGVNMNPNIEALVKETMALGVKLVAQPVHS